MDPDGIHVLHIADRDHVAGNIPHDLIFDLFPARDRALHQDLVNTGKPESALEQIPAGIFIFRNSASRTAEGVGRPEDDRISDPLRRGETGLKIMHDLRIRDRLRDFLHRLLEEKTVFRPADRLSRRTDQTDAFFLKKSLVREGHRQIESGLASHGRQDRVRLLPFDQCLEDRYGQRFDIHVIRDVLVRHDRRRVGVQEDRLDALLAESPAGLCPRIIKLRGLADHDRSGTDYKHFFYGSILHFSPLPILFHLFDPE